MIFRSILAVFIICLSLQKTGAQIYYEGGDRTVTVLSYEDKDNAGRKSKYDHKNAFKIGILDVLYGHQSIYYERSLNKIFSVQGSFGISHRNFYEDVSAIIGGSGRYYEGDFSYANMDKLYEYRGVRKVGIGYSVGINPRVYTNGWGMEGFYVGPSIRYQVNSYKYIENDLNEKESQKKFSIGLVLGGQSNNRPVCVDYGVGIGYKALIQRRYLTGVYDNQGQSMADGMYDFKSKGVNFEVYLNIGGFFGFKREKG